MNYNEENRTGRGRVLNNCNTCRTPRSCTCMNGNAASVAGSEIKKKGCACKADHTMVVRENRTACPRTTCTTVPVTESCVDTYPVAMAYVPMQQWRELYDPASAVSRGTIFRELDLEWYPTNCRKDCRRG